MIDISDRKKTEERIRQEQQNLIKVFETAPFGMLLIDQRLTIVRSNDYIGRIVGLNCEQIQGKKICEGLGCCKEQGGMECGGNCDFQNAVHRAFETNARIEDLEIKMEFNVNGSVKHFWLDIHTDIIFMNNQKYVIVGVTDVTSRVEAGNELQQAKEAAETANQSKSRFLANMSHELRTPLHAILSFSNFGLEKHTAASPEKIENYFRKIQDSGRTLLALLNDLLDLSKLESGKMTFDFQLADPVVIIESVVDEFLSLISERNIQIRFEPTQRGEKFTFDIEKIKQVLRNLLSNSVKFSPEGATITVSIETSEGWITVTVEDEGPGVPEEEKVTIFDKFVQSTKTKTAAGGTGLGLAICQEIVQAHQGEIWVKNNDGQGAKFTFQIPR